MNTKSLPVTMNNPQTGKLETIITQTELVSWGWVYYVNTEIEAYKVAYVAQSANGTEVEYLPTIEKWAVTKFNDSYYKTMREIQAKQ